MAKSKKRRSHKRGTTNRALSTFTVNVQVPETGTLGWNSSKIDVPFLSPGSVYNAIEIVQIDTITEEDSDFGVAIGGINLDGQSASTFPWVNQVLNKSNLWTFFVHDGLNQSIDTTDNNNKGLLYPNQALYFNVYSTPASEVTNYQFRIYYFLKKMTPADQQAVINQYLVQNP